jgi:hypothetical protein
MFHWKLKGSEIMNCPKCGKEMKQIHWEGLSLLNPMTCEEELECECGVYYQFSYGAERCLDKDGNEIDY